MTEINDDPSVPETVKGIILPSTELARTLAPLLADDIAVMSPDEAFASKVHLHMDDGQIATQLNIGASIDWETTLDMRL